MGRCKEIVKKLIIENGLLLTDFQIEFNEQSLHLQRVLVDTGSGSTVISTDLAESIGIVPEKNDTIYRVSGVGGSEFVYSKKIDAVRIGDMKIETFELEIGAMNYGFDLDGIIGLDLLQQLKVVINIDELILHSNR